MTNEQQQLLDMDLRRVVTRLHQEDIHVTQYRKDYRQLLDNHGKMVRAALVLLFARAQDPQDSADGALPERVITGAAAIEMLHLATLVHDDVLDNASFRRNQPTVQTRRGNKAAIYLGDLILSRYMEIMATIAPDTDFVRQQASTVCEIVGGDLLQESARHDVSTSLPYYEQAIRGKTAALFRLATQTGIELSARHPDEQSLQLAGNFGEQLGIAFQIIDDIDDFDLRKNTGKPKLEDIRDGIYTLPVILGIQSDQHFADMLGRDDANLVLNYLIDHPALIRKSKDIAGERLEQASHTLDGGVFNPSVKALLNRMIDTLAAQLN